MTMKDVDDNKKKIKLFNNIESDELYDANNSLPFPPLSLSL